VKAYTPLKDAEVFLDEKGAHVQTGAMALTFPAAAIAPAAQPEPVEEREAEVAVQPEAPPATIIVEAPQIPTPTPEAAT